MNNIHEQIALGQIDPNMGLKVGDLIMTYHKGFWRITDIKLRFVDNQQLSNVYQISLGAPRPSLVYYKLAAKSDGTLTPNSKRKKCCCVTLCSLVDKSHILQIQHNEIEAAKFKAKNLLSILKE